MSASLWQWRLWAGALQTVAPLLPARWHIGRRAAGRWREQGETSGPPLQPGFAHAHFAAIIQAQALFNWLRSASPRQISNYITGHVRMEASPAVRELLTGDDGLVLSTPHYGPFAVGCVFFLRHLANRRFNLFYDSPERNPYNTDFEPTFRKVQPQVKILGNDRRALMAAIKALRRGEVLTMMPDVVHDVGDAMAVRFMNRLMRAMPGTAFFAHTAAVPIIPVYCRITRFPDVEIRFGEAIDPMAYKQLEKREAQFRITQALFDDFERELGENPAPWIYWSDMLNLCSEIQGRGHFTDWSFNGCFMLARQIVSAAPITLRSIPELAELLESQHSLPESGPR